MNTAADKGIQRVRLANIAARSERSASLVVGFDRQPESHTALDVAAGLAKRGLRISAGCDRGEQRPVGLPGVEK
jgi:hypothetical protein